MATKMDIAGCLDAKTRETFNSAFDALSEWRDEITASTEQYGEMVFDKLVVGARAAGWPESLIETTKTQLLQASKVQTQMIDHMMEAWQDQLAASPGKFLGSLGQGEPGAGLEALQSTAMGNLAISPMQFWMQATEMWQKSWLDAMAMGGKPGDSRGPGSPFRRQGAVISRLPIEEPGAVNDDAEPFNQEGTELLRKGSDASLPASAVLKTPALVAQPIPQPVLAPTVDNIIIPVFVEDVSVAKQKVVTGRVRVSTVTHNREKLIDELLMREQVEIERVPVDRPIDAIPKVREDGDTTIIPIVEEVIVVERRLVLKEEIRLRRVRSSEKHQELVSFREQEALISRPPIEESEAGRGAVERSASPRPFSVQPGPGIP